MRTARVLTIAVPALALAACSGGSDAAPAPVDDAADAEPDTDTAVDDEAVDDPIGDAPDGGIDNPTGAEIAVNSGGPVGDDIANVCDLLDPTSVASIAGIEATAELNGADEHTATCVYGGQIELTVYRPDLAVDLSALEFLLQTATFNSQNGIEIDQSPLLDLPRASWSEGGSSTQALVVNPFYVELRDNQGRDAELSVLIGGVAEAMR